MRAKNCYPVVRFSGTPYRLIPSQKKALGHSCRVVAIILWCHVSIHCCKRDCVFFLFLPSVLWHC